MTKRAVGSQQAPAVWYGSHVLVEHLLGVYDGAYLQKVEVGRAVGIYIAGKLYLHGTAHGVGTIFHGHPQQLRQGNDALLENSAE